MHYKGGQVQSTIASDTMSLLDGELVVRFLDHEERARSYGLKLDPYF